MVLYNSYNLRTSELEVNADVTSTDCYMYMPARLNAFLRESDLQQVPTTNVVPYVQANVVVVIVLPYR
jgi:hypothetical protein